MAIGLNSTLSDDKRDDSLRASRKSNVFGATLHQEPFLPPDAFLRFTQIWLRAKITLTGS